MTRPQLQKKFDALQACIERHLDGTLANPGDAKTLGAWLSARRAKEVPDYPAFEMYWNKIHNYIGELKAAEVKAMHERRASL